MTGRPSFRYRPGNRKYASLRLAVPFPPHPGDPDQPNSQKNHRAGLKPGLQDPSSGFDRFPWGGRHHEQSHQAEQEKPYNPLRIFY